MANPFNDYLNGMVSKAEKGMPKPRPIVCDICDGRWESVRLVRHAGLEAYACSKCSSLDGKQDPDDVLLCLCGEEIVSDDPEATECGACKADDRPDPREMR